MTIEQDFINTYQNRDWHFLLLFLHNNIGITS